MFSWKGIIDLFYFYLVSKKIAKLMKMSQTRHFEIGDKRRTCYSAAIAIFSVATQPDSKKNISFNFFCKIKQQYNSSN